MRCSQEQTESGLELVADTTGFWTLVELLQGVLDGVDWGYHRDHKLD